MWQSQVESEHYSYQILTAFSDSALYNSRLKEAMALQFVVEIVLYTILECMEKISTDFSKAQLNYSVKLPCD